MSEPTRNAPVITRRRMRALVAGAVLFLIFSLILYGRLRDDPPPDDVRLQLPAEGSCLEDLVPAYLPSLPGDPFGGAPLRYVRERRVLYSIGSDLEDNGGDAKAVEEQTDVVFPLTWTPE